MPERERKQRAGTREEGRGDRRGRRAPLKQGEALKEELHHSLDEIDSVLESNAEEFVKIICAERGSMTLMSAFFGLHV